MERHREWKAHRQFYESLERKARWEKIRSGIFIFALFCALAIASGAWGD